MKYASLAFSRVARPTIEWQEMVIDPHGVVGVPLDVGFCGTDFQMLGGARPLETATLGHEGVIRIIEIGRHCQATRLLDAAKLFVINPVNPMSGTIVGHNRPGLLATVVSFSADDLVNGVLLPFDQRLDPALGPLVEPLAAAVYALELARRKVPVAAALVVGCGPMGLLVARLLQETGTKQVFLTDRTLSRLDHALALGLADPADAFLAPVLDEVLSSLAVRQNLDAVFFCANRAHGLPGFEAAVCALQSGGCIVMTSALPENGGALARAANVVRAANLCGTPTNGAYLCHGRSTGNVWITGHRGTAAVHLWKAQDLLAANPGMFALHLAPPVAFNDAPAMLDQANWPLLRATGRKHVIRVSSQMPSDSPST